MGRNEVGIMGAPCNDIKQFSEKLIEGISDAWNTAYIDAEHHAQETDEWSAVKSGAKAQYTDKISHSQIENSPEQHQEIYFNEVDLVLVNGNHFKVDHQVVYIHPKKTLEHKLTKLTHVIAILMDDSIVDVPDYLVEHLAGQTPPIFKVSETSSFVEFMQSWLVSKQPKLKGLVLAGGKSTRMESDKGLLNYNGIPQREYIFNLLAPHCDEVYLSCRDEEQAKSMPHECINDTFQGLGPYGGILSAFREDPNSAWLVVAVDLPYLDENTIQKLVSSRNVHKTATCFIDAKEEYPEPLITIWEPRAYPTLLKFLSKGFSCPRKVLLNSNTEILVDRDKKALTNVNTPEEHEFASKELSKAT